MSDRTEALARALGCDPYDVQTRPLRVDGVTIGGGIERRCGAHGRAMSQCQIAKAAERILADPGPLLAALAEADVLDWIARQAQFGEVRDVYATEWQEAGR